MAITKKEREQVFNKFGGKCYLCGTDLIKGWHVDHKEPIKRKSYYNRAKQRFVQTGNLSHPERDSIENKMPSCASCNINKRDISLEEFRALIQNFINSLNRDSTQYKIAKRYGLIQETGVVVKFYFETL